MPRMNTIGKTHTNIRTEKGVTIVRYHWTDVVKFSDKSITLDANGWFTSTTKNRMNQASRQFDLGYSVSQVKGSWVVSYKGKEMPFKSGMTLRRV